MIVPEIEILVLGADTPERLALQYVVHRALVASDMPVDTNEDRVPFNYSGTLANYRNALAAKKASVGLKVGKGELNPHLVWLAYRLGIESVAQYDSDARLAGAVYTRLTDCGFARHEEKNNGVRQEDAPPDDGGGGGDGGPAGQEDPAGQAGPGVPPG